MWLYLIITHPPWVPDELCILPSIMPTFPHGTFIALVLKFTCYKCLPRKTISLRRAEAALSCSSLYYIPNSKQCLIHNRGQ